MSEKLYQNREWLEEQYVTMGKYIKQIADEMGVTSNCIRQWLIKHQIPIRKTWIIKESARVIPSGKLPEEMRIKIANRYIQGESAYKIAASISVSSCTVCKHLRHMGIPVRHNAKRDDVSRRNLLAILPDKKIDKREGDRVAQEMIWNLMQPKQMTENSGST